MEKNEADFGRKFVGIMEQILEKFYGRKIVNFMGQKYFQSGPLGQFSGLKCVRENNTARKFRKKWPKKWSYGPKNWPMKYFWPTLKPLRHKGFRVF